MRYLLHIPAARQYFRGTSPEECAEQFEAWRDDEGYGARDIGAAYPLLIALTASGTQTRRIGTVHYNGRVEIDCAALDLACAS